MDEQREFKKELSVKWIKAKSGTTYLCPVNALDHIMNCPGTHRRLRSRNDIQEVRPLESHRRAAINLRCLELAEALPELVNAKPDIVDGIDVASQAEVNPGHAGSIGACPGTALDDDADVTRAANRPRLADSNPDPGNVEFVDHDGRDFLCEGLDQLKA